MLLYLPLIGNQSDNGIQHGGELNGSGNKLRECFKDKSSFEYLIPPHDANKRASPVKPRCPIPAESRGGSGRARESGSMSAAVRYTSATRRILPRRCTFFFFFSSSSFLRHSRLGDGVKIQRVQLVAGGSPTGSLNMRDLVAETLLSSSVLLHVRW